LAIIFTPLCSESLGVRSLCVFVETPDVKILLDAGVSLGQRFGLTPHPEEYNALLESREKIRRYAAQADVVTISHYHFDHYTATWSNLEAKWSWSSKSEAAQIYRGKTVYAKDYRSHINSSQRQRGYIFNKIASDFTSIIYSDSQTYLKDGTEITFTEPLPHGEENSQLGYITAVEITSDNDTLAFYPDVQGPISEYSLNRLLAKNPSTIIIGGPPLYLSGWRIDEKTLAQGLNHLQIIVEKTPLTLLDHHILRNEKGLEETHRLAETAETNGNRLRTFAEYLGLDNQLLEAKRRQLFEENPPTPEFRKWMNLGRLHQASTPPPL
jgi:predicted metallo-beta-lactamase superfamily hydrolase